VPSTAINPATGLATTTAPYFFVVTNAPFDGALEIMFNHDKARGLGAQYYAVTFDGVQPLQSFSDYLWNGTEFVVETTGPDASGMYPVRTAAQLWYNHFLGYQLDTSRFPTGLHVLHVQLYNAARAPIAGGSDSLRVFVDHRLPTASINSVIHDGSAIPPCGIGHTTTPFNTLFSFNITATQPENLYSWSLSALWGLNKSSTVASGTTNVSGVVPAAPGWNAFVPTDSSSTNCAHTFVLGVWDRTINGYGHVHYQEAHDSIDIRP
jgi:hypothetical protein